MLDLKFPAFKIDPILFNLGDAQTDMLWDLGDICGVLPDDLKFFVAGGALTSLVTNAPINDVDLFAKDEENLEKLIQWAAENATILSVTDRSIVCNHSGTIFNIITFRTFPTADSIFNSFDFTINMIAADSEDKDVFQALCSRSFLSDLRARKLVVNPNTHFPISTAQRVSKYISRGYSIEPNEMMKIFVAINALKIDSFDAFKAQQIGYYNEEEMEDIFKGEFSTEKLLRLLSIPQKQSVKKFTKEEMLNKLKEKYQWLED